MRRILKYLGASFVAVATLTLGSLFVFWLTFEPNSYRGVIEDTVSRSLGREVLISGDLELVPALIPTLAVNRVTIANPPWASLATMATAGRLEVRIALRPLLDGQIEMTNVILEHVDVSLERNPNGQGNWDFEFLSASSAAEQQAGGLQTQVGRVELRDITARYTEASRADISAHVESVILERSPAGRLSITAAGSAQGVPITAEWQAGPLDDAGTNPELRWPVAAALKLGDTTVTMTGRLRAPMAYTSSDLEIHIAGRNAAQLQALVNLPPSDSLIYDLRGRLRIDADSVRVDNLRGSLVEGNFFRDTRINAGSVNLTRGAPIEADFAGTASGLPFTLSSRLGLLREILQANLPWPLTLEVRLGEATLTASGMITARVAGTGASVDLAINGPLFESLNRLRPLGLPELGPIELETALVADPNEVLLHDLRLAFAGSAIEGDLELTSLATTPDVTATLTATTIDLAKFSSSPPSPAATPILDRPLPLDWLGRITGSVNLELDELLGLPVRLTDTALSAALSDGTLQLRELTTRAAGIQLLARGALKQSAGEANVELDVETQPLDSARLLPALGLADFPGLAWSTGPVALRLSARGSSIRAAADTSAINVSARPAEIDFANDSVTSDVTLSALDVFVEPGGAVRLESAGRFAAEVSGQVIDEAFNLSLTAGTLAELVSTQRLWPVIEVTAVGTYRGEPLSVTARTTDTAALLAKARTPVVLNAAWGPLEAGIDGSLVPTANLAGTVADIELVTDNMAAAAALLDIDSLPTGNGSFSGHVSIDEGELVLSELSATAPGVNVDGNVSLLRSDRLDGRADLHFEMLDLNSYLAPSEPQQSPDETVTKLALHDLYSEAPLDLEPLRGGEFAINVSIDAFRLGEFFSSGVELGVALERGALQIDASLDSGRISASASVDARANEIDLKARLSGDAVPLAIDRTASPASSTPVINFDANLTGRGTSSQTLAQSLDGALEIYLTGGRIRAAGFRFLFGSVLYELLEAINPFKSRQDFVDIDCVGAYFDVVDGVLSTSNGIIMQTPEIQVVGVGMAGLADGALQMQFRTKRRTGIVISIGGIVNEFVELAGTVDAPRVQISTGRATRSGLLAVATGGLSLLAADMFGRLTSGNVCADLPARVGAPGAGDD